MNCAYAHIKYVCVRMIISGNKYGAFSRSKITYERGPYIMKYASLAIHGGRQENVDIKGVNYPLCLSSTFVQNSIGEYGEFVYSRSNNPTRNHAEQLGI